METIHGNISVSLPPGWVDRTSIVFVREQTGDFSSNLVFTKLTDVRNDETVEAYALRSKDGLAADLEGFSMEYSGPANASALRGFKLQYTFLANDIKLRQYQIFTLLGRTVYSVTYTDIEENFERLEKAADDLLSRLIIRKGSA
jgi:hypothetical protein